MIFGQYTRVDSDRIHRFCPARSDCNNIAHAIRSCDKLQGAFNQFTEKVWKLQLKYFSYKRDQRRSFASTFICISKFTNLYERILKMQALIGLKDCHKPMGISVAFIHQHLKDNANPRVCSFALLWMIVCTILKLDQDLLLTVQTSFVYPLRWGFQVSITTEWRIDAELSYNFA